jgi:anti-sigma regulatory factor (Ser/Thr protein kinase)
MQGPARLDLPQHAASVARARSFVRQVCIEAGLSFELCDTAVLLTSETVTNSFRHARGGARLSVTADADGLLVEVGDDDPRPPHRRSADSEALSGRGMAIVDLLASRWGTYTTPAGKVVWFRVGLP